MNPFFPPPFFYDDEGEGKTFRTKKKEVGGADKKLGAREGERERCDTWRLPRQEGGREGGVGNDASSDDDDEDDAFWGEVFCEKKEGFLEWKGFFRRKEEILIDERW